MLAKVKLFKSSHSNEEGFTLIESMIVVVIIGILAAIAITIFANQQKAATSAGLKTDVRNVLASATEYKTKNNGKFPTTCQDWLKVFPNGFKSGSTSAIGVTASPDGMNLWIETQGQGMGSNSGGGMTLDEVDSYTAMIDTKTGGGVTNRKDYMAKYGYTNRAQVFYDAGYTNSGWFVTSLPTCQVWGAVTP